MRDRIRNRQAPHQNNLLQLVVPPNSGAWRVHIAISQVEAGVIGLVIVQWAFLELALYERTRRTAKRAGLPIPNDATATSFSKRLSAFRQLVEKVIVNRPRRAKLLKLCDRIAKAAGNRHKVAHGLWSFNPQKPNQLFVKNEDRKLLKATGSTRQIWYHPFTATRLGKISEEIGALSFELWYGRGSRNVKFSQPYVSRSFLLATQASRDDGA